MEKPRSRVIGRETDGKVGTPEPSGDCITANRVNEIIRRTVGASDHREVKLNGGIRNTKSKSWIL